MIIIWHYGPLKFIFLDILDSRQKIVCRRLSLANILIALISTPVNVFRRPIYLLRSYDNQPLGLSQIPICLKNWPFPFLILFIPIFA